jgi:uncharacterized protein (DUF427 family)
MPSAKWNGQVIAETEQFETVEGNIYFPRGSLKDAFFKPSSHATVCPWKGIASYFDIVVDGKVNENAAWYYADPKEAAHNIKDHVAFWKGVEVSL